VNQKEFKAAVVIPAYNEQNIIGKTVKALLKFPIIERIVVVDDGSSDNTAVAASDAGADVISMPVNRGKAYAMKKGYEAVTSPIIVFLDADLGESADQVLKLIEPIYEGKAEAVIARFPMTPGRGGFGLVKQLAAKGLHFLTGKQLSSVLSGQRAFLRSVLKPELFDYSGFGIEFGMTVDMLTMDMQVQEVDVNMKHRTTGRDIRGFLHRFRQFRDILGVFIKKLAERMFLKLKCSFPKEHDKA